MRLILLVVLITISLTQGFTQSFTGQVTDNETREPLIGANVLQLSSSDSTYTVTDEEGSFSFDEVTYPVTLEISYLGYSKKVYTISEPEASFVASLEIDESNIAVSPIVIANPMTSNDVTFSRKEFQILPGAYEDPSRLLLKAPGFTTSNDQANFILYKGLPSNFVNWSLNGAPVVNPNHTSNAGSLSDVSSINAGGVNMISSQVIGRYDFQSAPYGMPYNNTIAGSSDIGLSQYEKSYLNLSLVGLEAGYGFSGEKLPGIQLNYRYSFVGILTGVLGLDFGGEKINYQDLFAKVDLIEKENESLSAFFTYGNSANLHEAVDERDKTSSFKDISDIRFDSDIILSGLRYKRTFANYKFDGTINYSQKEDQRFSITRDPDYSSRNILQQKLLSSTLNFDKPLGNSILQFGANINYTIDNRSKQIFNFDANQLSFKNLNVFPYLNYSKESTRFFLDLGTGLSYNSITGAALLEPSVKLTGKLARDYSITIDYRKNSQLLSAVNFSYDYEPREIIGNHFEASFNVDKQKFDLFFTGYAHYMSQLLTEDNSNYSQFTGLDNPYLGAYNYDGKARSIGVSYGFAIRDFLLKNLTFNANASNFDASFTNHQNNWLDNTFNFSNSYNLLASYVINFQKDKEILISLSTHQRGGLKEFEIEAARSTFTGEVSYDFTTIPQQTLANYSRIDFRFLYNLRKGRFRKYAQSISLDIQNIGNKENDAFTNLDFFNGDIFVQKQLGLIPVLAYRIEF